MAPSKSLFFCLVFALAALTSVTATDPRRSSLARAHHRHAIAARHPTPVEQPNVPLGQVKRKRQTSRRCVNRPAPIAANGTDASTIPLSSSSSHPKPTPAPAPAPQSPPPEPKTTKAAPPPSPPPAPPKTTKAAPPPPPPSPPPSNPGGPSFLNGPQTGQATFYEVGGAAVACGENFNDNDMIAAASKLLFDAFPGATGNPNQNPICGRSVTATWQGRSVTVKIFDRCEACALTDLDLSPAAFNVISNNNEGLGRLSGMVWTWD